MTESHRCACGRARRAAAALCQRCLDALKAEFRAKEPPARWARHWRADGWFCIFLHGNVILAQKTPHGMLRLSTARTMPIGRGEWAYAVDQSQPPWRSLGDKSFQLADLLRRIARDCYCSSFPSSGCDFCNGTRLPDGAQEM